MKRFQISDFRFQIFVAAACCLSVLGCYGPGDGCCPAPPPDLGEKSELSALADRYDATVILESDLVHMRTTAWAHLNDPTLVWQSSGRLETIRVTGTSREVAKRALCEQMRSGVRQQ